MHLICVYNCKNAPHETCMPKFDEMAEHHKSWFAFISSFVTRAHKNLISFSAILEIINHQGSQ